MQRSAAVRLLSFGLASPLGRAAGLFGIRAFGPLLGAIACTATEPAQSARFVQTVLEGGLPEPIGLAVLPNNDVLYTTRRGEVRYYDADAQETTLAGSLAAYAFSEEGLQGIAVDPGFPEQPWVYLYYSPSLGTPRGEAFDHNVDEPPFEAYEGFNRLSRFRLVAAEEGGKLTELDQDSEQVLLEIPTQRGVCCHIGGQVDFDAEGNLYLSTGDDTNPFASGGFTPIDERPERGLAFDAQRSAANTNDLRGKLLRIRVEADGSYSIPEGNLFPPGTEGTRPEIYLMGLRNPFRFAVDRKRGLLFLADYAPDSFSAEPQRGPAGQGKWMVVREPGNHGWPYCATAELPYTDFDFATEVSGDPFDCSGPVNDSPNNTGLRQLPPVVEPDFSYSYATSQRLPELGQGQVGPMAGPAFDSDAVDRVAPASGSAGPDAPLPEGAWPSEYEGLPLFYEWGRGYLLPLRIEDDGPPQPVPLPNDLPLSGPIDMEFGRDGALYVLEYGTGYFSNNPEAQLSRITYSPGSP